MRTLVLYPSGGDGGVGEEGEPEGLLGAGPFLSPDSGFLSILGDTCRDDQ